MTWLVKLAAQNPKARWISKIQRRIGEFHTIQDVEEVEAETHPDHFRHGNGFTSREVHIPMR